MTGSFGELLRRFRVAASLTQEALAERARVSSAAIAALERGKRRAPRLSTVRELADALDLSPSDRAELASAATGLRTTSVTELGKEPGARPVVLAEGRSWMIGRGPDRRPLPSPLTPLLGRQVEVAAVAHELATVRLVTLVGPGGVGKTRLALRVAQATLDKFEGGTWWVDLGPVNDPEAVGPTVLEAVGGTERPGGSLARQIVAMLRGDPVLLVIDNCEHVLDAAAGLIAELVASPWITVLVTSISTEPLAIPGEISWLVPALAVPPEDATLSAEALADIDSVQLFVERAGRAKPGFASTDDNADALARFAGDWMVSRWPSSWPRPGSACSTRPHWPTSWRSASRS